MKKFKRLLSISLSLLLSFSPVEFVGELFGGIESYAEDNIIVPDGFPTELLAPILDPNGQDAGYVGLTPVDKYEIPQDASVEQEWTWTAWSGGRCKASLYSDGTLFIDILSGSGSVSLSSSSDKEPPWHAKRGSIKRVILSESVSQLDVWLLIYLSNADYLEIRSNKFQLRASETGHYDNGFKKIYLPYGFNLRGGSVNYPISFGPAIKVRDGIIAYPNSADCIGNYSGESTFSSNGSYRSGTLYQKYLYANNATYGKIRDVENRNLEYVYVPKGVNVFINSKYVKWANISELDTVIDKQFENSGLYGLVTKPLKEVGDYGFSGCTKLQSVTLDDNAIIGDNAFNGASNVIINNIENVRSIGKSGLSGVLSINKLALDNLYKVGSNAFEGCINLKEFSSDTLTSIPKNAFIGSGVVKVSSPTVTVIEDAAFKDTNIDNLYLPNLETLGKQVFMNCTQLSGINLSNVTSIGDDAFNGCSKLVDITLSNNLISIGSNVFNGSGVSELIIPESVVTQGVNAIGGTNISKATYFAPLTNTIEGATNLKELYLLGGISSSAQKQWIPSTTIVYVEKGSEADVWCENNNVYHVHLTDEELDGIKNGIKPSIESTQKLHDAQSPADISFTYDLGKKPAGADSVKKVYCGNSSLSANDYIVDTAANTITINESYLNTLANGIYQVSVLFNNDVYATGVSLTVMNSTVSGNGDNIKPPEALTMINYEFYKDYPDYVTIPVKMNSATDITRLVIGKDEVPNTAWELQDSAIILDKDWLASLDAGKYRVKPTFNDIDNTTISNIQLIVYDKVSDRGAPYLLQSVIDFSGQTLRLRFDGGFGDLGAEHVLALVIDDELILPNGDRMPFSKSNVTKVQKAMEVVEEDDEELYDVLFEEEEEEVATSSNARPATPSNATYYDEDDEAFEEELIDDLQVATPGNATYKKSSSKKVKGSSVSLIRAMADTLFSADTVFHTEGDEIVVDGDYISSMNLTPGDHLVGAIFDNTERTTDVKKVVLRIADDSGTDDGNTDNPGGEGKPDQKPNPDGENKPNPGEDGKPDTGEDNKPGEDDKPGTNKPSKPNGGGSSGGGSGGSSGGSSGSRPSGSKPSEPGKNNDGSYNTGYRPSVQNTGGSFLTDENGNKVYMFPDGETPKATWVGDGKNWYYVEANGMVRTDWFLDSATGYWYQLCKEPGDNYGAMLCGWYYEKADGKWYFLSPIDGHMLIGWQFINHEWYYMTEVNNGQTYFGDNVNGWLYDPTKAWKPFGSMWCNEMTPDNYFVTESGAWKK